MSKFNILVCEDLKKDQDDIELFILGVNRDLHKVEISYTIVDFSEVFKNLDQEFDLLILDLSDNEHGSSGENVIMHNDGRNKIPTLIYTSTGDKIAFDFDTKQLQYPFLIKKLVKLPNNGSNLKNFLKGYIITETENEHYKLYNANDTYLQLAINYIGIGDFKYILYSVFEKYNSEPIIVYPMTSGWSGAVLFKLIIGHDNYILKLSKDIDSLRTEHENGLELFSKFPTHLINSLEADEFYSFNETVYGILIKNVENPETLHTFATNQETTQSKVDDILKKLYLEADCLQYVYESKTGEKKDWTSILEKIDINKIKKIKESYKELKPIINEFYENIDIEKFRRVCVAHDFKNLDQSNLLDSVSLKPLVLSHGDFHSKNILIQSSVRPIIIDTGALGYHHWALDISRLITSIFILGLDNDSVNYYDLNRIDYYIEIGKKIISKEPIVIKDDDENKNALNAIQWVLDNIETIYETQFSLFEYQLGIMKEFLQVSYRSETVPPNKRALALILADISLNKANENVK